MATVLRVKRRVVDDHPEALVIAKKRKANDDGQSDDTADETSSTTVLKFAGTTNIREDSVVKSIKISSSKNEHNDYFKQRVINVLRKHRLDRKKAFAENRFKVINARRAIDTPSGSNDANVITVIDLEDSVSLAPAVAPLETSYVYDLYYTEKMNAEINFDDGFLVHPLEQQSANDSCQEISELPDIAEVFSTIEAISLRMNKATQILLKYRVQRQEIIADPFIYGYLKKKRVPRFVCFTAKQMSP